MSRSTNSRSKRASKAAVAGAAALAGALGSAQASELALKRAVLGSGGVGYFEYEAEVDGASPLRLRARLDQVDDILKSLIVMDPAGAASVSLPGKAGAAQAFASLPFSEEDLSSLPALIGALKGARVTLEAPRKLAGTILSATPETVSDKDGATKQITRVALLSGLAVEQFVLEEAQGLAFEDQRLGAQVEAALAALRAAKDKSGRDVAINLVSGGKRMVRVGYVAEAPVWKAAYRLSLPQGEGKARLQGWAVLENMTGADWDGVALTLTSGSPVTFRQALYEPYFVARPTVPPPVPRLALPRLDEGQMPIAAAMAAKAEQSDAQRPRRPAPMAAAPRAGVLSLEGSAVPAAAAPPSLGASASDAATAADGALGAAFSLSAPVKAKAGESLSLPFLDVETSAADSSWVQSGAAMKNPWRAVRLTNAGGSSWPAGSVTLYETTAAGPLFAGEAQLPTTPAGQERLLAFGADAKVSVDRERTGKGVVSEIALSRGMLQVTRILRETTLYRVKNDDARAREIVIDQPRVEGATLIAPKPDEAALSGRDWRIKKSLKPGETLAVEVTFDRPVGETVAIADASRESVARLLFPNHNFETMTRESFAAVLSDTKLEPAAIERLQKIADAAEAVGAERRKIEALDEERGEIVGDQERIRENLKSVGSGGDFGRGLVAKLQAQETRLGAIEADKAKARAALAAAQKILDDLIGKAGAPTRFRTGQTF